MNLPDGWFSNENIREYRRLVEKIPQGGLLVELGVWKGKSLCSVADIILRKKIRVIAVDTFKGTDSEGEAHKFAKEFNLREEFEKNIKNFFGEFALVGTDIKIFEMTTNEASVLVKEEIDLLFIDAGHTYEDVKQDIENWYPKVKGTIAGHDYSQNWKGVIKAVDEKFGSVKVMGDIWSKPKIDILCYVSTCNRTDTTLPLTLVSIAMQTLKPDHLIIFDDNKERRNFNDIEVYQYCFKLLYEKGITSQVIYGEQKGQHHNHEKANTMSFTYNWRIDDDEIAEPTCLEELFKEMKDGVGAVGGLVTQPVVENLSNINPPSGVIPNIQWFNWDGEPREVEDLYSSFLYLPNIVHFDLRLSSVAHKEETMFTESFRYKGYKLIVTPKAKTQHFRSAGGIRSGQGEEMFKHDEQIYRAWTVFRKLGKKLYVLNNGIGDHYMFLQAITPEKDSVIACCYPEILKGYNTISIAEAQAIVDIKDYDIYKWCVQNNWKGTLIDAFKKLYEDIS
ncbi:MAG: class I SAM-dependent methyltransferase [Patescibacteria group bacterium]